MASRRPDAPRRHRRRDDHRPRARTPRPHHHPARRHAGADRQAHSRRCRVAARCGALPTTRSTVPSPLPTSAPASMPPSPARSSPEPTFPERPHSP
ncbi:hypothetical protein AMK15_28575 [Streptomyces sp. MJM1172]|nr:hypothetical protein AMK15_28575 [Streptomyces sp. MJM1172]